MLEKDIKIIHTKIRLNNDLLALISYFLQIPLNKNVSKWQFNINKLKKPQYKYLHDDNIQG